MDRVERLLMLVAHLRCAAREEEVCGRSAGAARVADLAAALGVSTATVRRDLAVLAEHGLAVRRSGGGVMATVGGGPVSSGEAEYSMAWPVVETVARAVVAHRVVRIVYAAESGERSVRDVEAHGLVVAPYGQYLVGYCRLREGLRTFRLDRVLAARLEGGWSGRGDIQDLMGALRVPAPRPPLHGEAEQRSPLGGRVVVPVAPGQARAWALERLRVVRERAGEVVRSALAAREGLAELRVVVAHLAEWTRLRVAQVRKAAEGVWVVEGRRPELARPFDGPRFDEPMPYLRRETLVQDAMAVRSFGELARDLDEVLVAAGHWAAGCDEVLWAGPVGATGRPLADLLAGWNSPLAHVEWHLDRLEDAALAAPADLGDSLGRVGDEEELEVLAGSGLLVTQCPLRSS